MLKHKHTITGVPISKLSHGSDKKVILICDDCGKETVTSYSNYTNAQKRHKRDGETYCRKCMSIRTGNARRGKHEAWNKGNHMDNSERNMSPWISTDGYRMVFDERKSYTRQNGWASYKKEHILIFELELGRKLRQNEQVHHIDGNKLNNKRDNLHLCKSNSEHTNLHSQITDFGYELVKAGFIKFANGKYMAHDKL
ncbi:MAG: HNH endonuclease, partial [Actinobacteria bacterium]|nr:HNH endonuclease [Actinomycetota bacterium]